MASKSVKGIYKFKTSNFYLEMFYTFDNTFNDSQKSIIPIIKGNDFINLSLFVCHYWTSQRFL